MTFAKQLLSAVLYTSLAFSASPVLSADRDIAALSEMRAADMRKMVFHPTPKPAPTTPIVAEDGREFTLAEYNGKVVLLNFWATWCAPCRAEMPALDRLQQDLGGERFAVVTVATGRNPAIAIDRFFEEADLRVLPRYLDPKQELAREMAVFGLPTSMVLDEEGREIGRLRGEADWGQPEAVELIRAIIGSDG